MIIEIENGFRLVAAVVALGVEAAAILVIAFGSVEALIGTIRLLRRSSTHAGAVQHVWVRFAGWILLSLEFTLGADIIRTAISPTWDEVGKLAAVAFIRTALNYFLSRDIQEALKRSGSEAKGGACRD